MRHVLTSNRIDLQRNPRTNEPIGNLFAEGLDEFLGVNGSDPRDHARAEILLDAVDRRRRRGFQEPRLELQAVRAVVDPLAAGRDPLSCRDRRRLTYDRREVAMAARLHAENAEAVRLVVEGDPLDEAGQDFPLFHLGAEAIESEQGRDRHSLQRPRGQR